MDKHQLATVFPCYAVGNRERVAARTATHTVAINGANANAEHRRSLSWDLFRRDGAPPVRAAEWWLRERERERERKRGKPCRAAATSGRRCQWRWWCAGGSSSVVLLVLLMLGIAWWW